MKRTRLIIALLLLLPAMLLGWLTLTQSGMLWLYQQVEFFLPMELSINKLEGRLIGPIAASGIEYQQDGTVIKADQLSIDWRPSELLIAHIDISQLHIRALSIALPESEETEQTQSQPSEVGLPEIHLPWRLLLNDGEIDGFSISKNGQLFSLKKINLDATTLFSRISIKQLAVLADSYSVQLKGDLWPVENYQHNLEVDWQLTPPSASVIMGHGQIKGDMKSILLKQQLTGALQLTLDGEINDVLDQLNWQSKIDVSRFDVSQLDASWPAFTGAASLDAEGDLYTAELTGTLQGKYPELGDLDATFDLQRLSDNTVQINQLMVHLPQSDTTIDTHGSWLPAKNGGDVDLSLSWRNLRWPLLLDATTQQQHWFNTASGDGTLKGNLDRYEIDITTDSPWPQYLASTWHARATGNTVGMNFNTLRIDAMSGEAVATGELKWIPQLSWKADISTAGIDPASLWPQWPGQLNAKISSSGRLENGQLIAEADISQLKGKLRNYPVSLHSRLRWQDNKLDISMLDFRSGKSQVKLDGQIGETMKLNWAVDSGNLAELYPLFRGKLQANGLVSGPQQTPFIEANFNGKTLSYPNYEIATIDGSMAVDLFHWRKIDIRMAAQSLNINNIKLKSLDINADSQSLEARATSKKVTTSLSLKGQSVATGWRGHIEQITVQSEYFDNWQLDSPPVALDVSDTTLTVDTFCLHNDRDARLCTSVDRQASAWHARVDLNKLPLKLLSHWLPSELKLEGVANGSAEAKLQTTPELTEQLLAQANIELPASAIVYPMLDGESDRREYRNGTIKLALDAQELNASAELTMANDDHLYARVELPGFNPLSAILPEQPVKASARMDIRDLKMFESIVEEVHELQGELKLNLKAAGTLDHPLLSGRADLSGGSLQIPRLGLDIEQLTFNSQSDGREKLNFHLDARSGGGKLAVDGNTLLDRSAGWPTRISIKGNSFEASSIPEARVMVSPDLLIELENRNIDISGNIHIPYAKLQPKDVARAETVSSDSVIIGGEQPPEEKWFINTSVRLTLGDRVHFYGFGFEGRLGGSLLLEDKPGQLTRATGQITIPEGVYQAYGQRLQVENGRILYTGGPLTNPGLDIRAVRKVDEVTAGILVKGTLNQPQLDIFSTPAMNQTDALAYIILGRPIDNASKDDGNTMAKAALALGLTGGDTIARSLGDRFGLDEMRVESSGNGDQAALVVGRYLSPRLYASYGIGIIDSVNTLTLRYQISSKWQIKAESGEAQGADILYTIDR